MDAPDRRNRLKDIQPLKFEEKKPKKSWLLFAVCVIVLLVLATLSVFGYKYYVNNLQPSDTVYNAHVLSTHTVTTDEGGMVYAPYKSGIVIATRNQICFYNTKGETEWTLEVNILNPILKVNENYILLAGKNTKDLYLIIDGEIRLHSTATYNILNAGVAKNGTFYIIEDEPYYKGLLTVRDSKNKDLFVWHSGTSYIIDAAFNDRASQIALTTLSATPQLAEDTQAENTYTSSLLLFKLHESTPYKTYEYKDHIAANVYHTSGRYIAVTDSSVHAYAATNGESVWSYDIAPHTLSRVAFADGRLALLTMAEDGSQVLQILKADGTLAGTKTEGLRNTGSISLSKNIVALGSGGGASVYNLNGNLQYKITLPKTYNNICLYNNGQYLLGANNVVLDLLSTK